MIVHLSCRIVKKKLVQQILPFAIISGIGIFGLISTSMLITLNMNSIYFQVQTILTQYLATIDDADEADDKNNKAFIMVRPTYTWLLKYGLDEGRHHDYQSYDNLRKIHRSITEGKHDTFIFVVDGRFKADLNKITAKQYRQEIQAHYKDSTTLAKINVQNPNIRDLDQYPYSTNLNMIGKGWGSREIRISH